MLTPRVTELKRHGRPATGAGLTTTQPSRAVPSFTATWRSAPAPASPPASR